MNSSPVSTASSLPSSEAVLAPVAAGDRIEAVDILRGIAVLGILLVNMGSYAGFRLPFQDMAFVDRAATVATRFLAQGKFYPLFSFLFGWGMAIQMSRATGRSVPFVPLYVRRLLALLLIGLVHAILIWQGDILVTYALLGFPLLVFRRASDRVLFLAAAIGLAVPVLISLPGSGADFRRAYGELTSAAGAGLAGRNEAEIFAAGTYSAATQFRVHWLRLQYATSLYWITQIFAMMLLGLWAGRAGILSDVERHRNLLRKIAWWGLVVGLVLNTLWVWVSLPATAVPAEWNDLATRGARTIGGSALAVAAVAGVTLLAQRAAWREQFAGLAAVGRMALTNYLLQSLVFTLVFYGYGLGVYGELGPFFTLLLALIFYRLQVAFSRWWLARFRFGPVEWLWRVLTYGRMQPMRLA